MPHSLQRQGIYTNLGDDFVVLTSPGREFADLQLRMNKFREIGFRYQPVNVLGVRSLRSQRHLVYDSREKVCKVLKDLATADLELSVLVSGLRDQVAECCHDAGLSPHTVNQSLGFWGKTEQLPPFRILEITTMCGHGRVPPNLVWELTEQVQQHSVGTGEAARKMGKLCLCNIFNEVRAARLLGKLVTDLEIGTVSKPQPESRREIAVKKDSGITIDEVKCIQCLECIPYCPVAAIVESPNGRVVTIDAERCTECGLCRQATVCPVDAIVARDLTWPRSLRGRFQSLYAPYRSAHTMQPLSYHEEVHVFSRHELPGVGTNDVGGLLRHSEAVIAVELGRPHLGTTFRDVQKVIQALLPMGLQLRLQYPVLDERSSLAELAIDTAKGILRQEILEERAGWVVLSLVTQEGSVPEVIRGLQKIATEIDTIFALDITSRVAEDGYTVAERVARETGVKPAINCKTNVGLGRPLADN
ncbi:4Fe-4S binding protein [Chloroflexota bacterium]